MNGKCAEWNWQRKKSIRRKTCPSATWSTQCIWRTILIILWLLLKHLCLWVFYSIFLYLFVNCEWLIYSQEYRFIVAFYVLLTVHPCVISQISPNKCTILLNIFISLLYMFRASMGPSLGVNYCIYATLDFVTLYGWLLVCWLDFNPTSRPKATHTEWRIPLSHRYSNFLLKMGRRMPETCKLKKKTPWP